MAKQSTKSGEKKGTRSRKMRDLPAKSLGVRKAASVKGGRKAGGTQQEYIKITMQDVTVSS